MVNKPVIAEMELLHYDLEKRLRLLKLLLLFPPERD